MPDYPHLFARIFDEPLLADPKKVEAVAAVLLRRAGVEVNVAAISGTAAPAMGPLQEAGLASAYDGRPFLFDPQSGIAVIEVLGSLAHRQGYVGVSSGIMGYDGIGSQLLAALDATDVRGIVFDIHSFGGEVSGAFTLADRIAQRRKPMIAVADEVAASAAYLIAAATGTVMLASPTSMVGSVGVVSVHFSFEEALKTEGVKPTIIQAGAHKADGNPYQNLPEDVRDRFQARVDYIYGEFTSRVAAWRGMPEDDVPGTEADVFMGRGAVDVGFADGIADPETIFAAFADEINSPGMRAA